tara:strand:+ start:752 stop:1234 length:483 start_codon:yes stop_codon:yes gene_type:complete
MGLSQEQLQRLAFLARVVSKEIQHLHYSDSIVFSQAFTLERAESLEKDQDLALQVEAFVSRFGRLQDTIGDKLLPQWLKCLGEKPAAFIDNLRRAEKLGVLDDAEQWVTLRQLRNQMVLEYIESPLVLSEALHKAHESIKLIAGSAEAIILDMKQRAWVE